jgi:DEAD/DEAH box helicase domain-containing protein
MDDELVIDVETKKNFRDVGGYNPHKLGISVVGAYSSKRDKYFSFLEGELDQLWPLMEGAERIIGYNITDFDMNVLRPYYIGKMEHFPVFDLMTEVASVLNFRPKLDSIAKATLGVSKLGNGLDAIEYFAKGEIEKLKKYCLKDVELTWRIYDLGKKSGKLKVLDLFGKTMEFKVDFNKKVERGDIGLTLPF